MKTLAIIFILLFSCCSVFAQITQEWVSFYNGPINDEDLAFSVAVDGSGNVYVTGLSWSNTERDFATIKYNSSGVQQWVQRYNGPGNHQDESYAVQVDNSGNVYVTGRSRTGTTSETEDYVTIKYSSSGVQQWLQRYNGPGNGRDWPGPMLIDGSGNVYITGRSMGNGTNFDYCTIKYNTSGVQQWVQRYNGPGNDNDRAYYIAIDNSGNVYVTGASVGSGTGSDYATIKYNTSGVQQWVHTYNGPGNADDLAYSVFADNSGNVYVTGLSVGSGTGSDYTTIKYNSSGVQQWIQRYNSASNINDIATFLKVDGSGNVFVTGQCEVNSTDRDFTTIMYNSAGVQQWLQTYNGPKDPGDWGWRPTLAIDNLSSVYVSAYSRGSGAAIDIAIIKYNSAGVQQWVQTYNGPGNSGDGASSVQIDGSGNIYVTGTSISSTDNDFVTIKYSQQIGVQKISTEIPNSFSLSQNYPNPFNPETIINFQLPMSNYVKLNIYDALGREVATLVNEKLSPGTYEVDWNASDYPSGVYFYSISTSLFKETKRMVLIK